MPPVIEIADGNRARYPAAVGRRVRIGLMFALWACALAAPAGAAVPVADSEALPAPTGASPPPVTRDDASKLDEPAPDKEQPVGKVKECCGYPVALREGFRLSFYWLAYESEYAHEPYDTEIYTPEGFFIGRFPQAFVYELKLEGTAVLRDGRVFNYAGACNYGIGTCFRQLDLSSHPLGVGVQGRPLVPFRSIAVDPRMIPIGAPVWVPELAGVRMPDGSLHDGCLRADDQGGAIKFEKLDFFVESYQNFKYIADNLWWRLKATPHVDEPRCEYLRLGQARERLNEHTDWAALHKNPPRQAARRALATIHKDRKKAKAWLHRQKLRRGTAIAGGAR
jgi:3D (Asp-Asp-Asp) domain-containing protein